MFRKKRKLFRKKRLCECCEQKIKVIDSPGGSGYFIDMGDEENEDEELFAYAISEATIRLPLSRREGGHYE